MDGLAGLARVVRPRLVVGHMVAAATAEGSRRFDDRGDGSGRHRRQHAYDEPG